jgi:cysteine-rich repeat protein
MDDYHGCWYALCGDGRTLGPNEECDDGNLENGDGCNSTCKIERGWKC